MFSYSSTHLPGKTNDEPLNLKKKLELGLYHLSKNRIAEKIKRNFSNL